MARYDNRTGFWGLFNPINKTSPTTVATVIEGAEELEQELDIKLPDSTILSQIKDWEDRWSTYAADVKRKQDAAKNYYLGVQYTPIEMKQDKRPQVDNLIFESLETFLPIATRANPDPLVTADNTVPGNALADKVKNMLAYQAQEQKLRMLLKRQTRDWAISFIGILKVGWDYQKDDICTENVKPNRIILDPDFTILDGGIYSGKYIGERKTIAASILLEMFPKQSDFIKNVAQDKLGTNITYTEWWTNDYVFYTLQKTVLGKYQNPHWNYDGTETVTGTDGEEIERDVIGKNHFTSPQMPYIFLSVFNLGEHPHDDTSLIYQNLANQDLINKRARQIDRNADSMNNGLVLSGDAFTREQAAEAGAVLARGGVLFVPNGAVANAYVRDQAHPLPPDVFNQLADTRNEVRNIFGTSGSSPQAIQNEDTVRGKIMATQMDSSRIGGGVTEYIEQCAQTVYNWWVQMFYVYYDTPHDITILGKVGTQEMTTLKNTELGVKLVITVKEGSLIPKDPLTERNEAIDLWNAKALDPITLFEKLDYPDPKATAEQLFKWMSNPASLFPDIPPPMPAGMPGQPQGQPPPGLPEPPPAMGQPPQPPAPDLSQQLISSVPTQ